MTKIEELLAVLDLPEEEQWCSLDKLLTSQWFQCTAQPIHWIIAFLIAKELSKAEKNNG